MKMHPEGCVMRNQVFPQSESCEATSCDIFLKREKVTPVSVPKRIIGDKGGNGEDIMVIES